MERAPTLLTPRLLMRRWRPADLDALAALNADPEVLRFFPSLLTSAQSAQMIERIEAAFERDGFGLWALELRAGGELAGFAGLSSAQFTAHFTPAVEVGWRLARSHWGHGYATEAGHAALAFGFERAKLDEIVSFTATGNERSRAVMARLGLLHVEDGDFDHPLIAGARELRRHVLYRMTAGRWAARNERPLRVDPSARPASPAPLKEG